MESVFESINSVEKRQIKLANDTEKHLDKLIKLISACQQDTTKCQSLLDNAKEISQKIQSSAKDYHTVLSKCTKAIDKKFKVDLENVWDPKAFANRSQMLSQMLVQHFVREGRFDLAETFCSEAGIMFEETKHNEFLEMFHIQEALRSGNVQPAIKWATLNSESLKQTASSLEFKLHQLNYTAFIRKKDIGGGMQYAKAHFHKFSDRFMKTIQQLICSILFVDRLDNCPYSHLYDQSCWLGVQTQFSREYSHIAGQSFECPLFTCVTVGSTALPMIMKISSLMKDKSLEWTSVGELPVTIPLLDSQRYHSIFVCPVTKEQGSEANPPMLMACGHVISKESLSRLSKGSLNSRFKCPYCPIDSTASQALRVYF